MALASLRKHIIHETLEYFAAKLRSSASNFLADKDPDMQPNDALSEVANMHWWLSFGALSLPCHGH